MGPAVASWDSDGFRSVTASAPGRLGSLKAKSPPALGVGGVGRATRRERPRAAPWKRRGRLSPHGEHCH